MVLLTAPSALDLLVCNGENFFIQPISARVCRIGTIYLAGIKMTPYSAVSAEVMTNSIIWAMVSTGTFHMGSGSFPDKKICAPARLGPLDSL